MDADPWFSRRNSGTAGPGKILDMDSTTQNYNASQVDVDRKICELLAAQIDDVLPEAVNKVWHAHPVWFIDGNPVVGYSKLKGSVRL